MPAAPSVNPSTYNYRETNAEPGRKSYRFIKFLRPTPQVIDMGQLAVAFLLQLFRRRMARTRDLSV
jgi:hypothetical protein